MYLLPNTPSRALAVCFRKGLKAGVLSQALRHAWLMASETSPGAGGRADSIIHLKTG